MGLTRPASGAAAESLPASDPSAVTQADPASGHQAHVSHFGVLKAAPTIVITAGNFASSTLDTAVWNLTESNSATLTLANNHAELDCGTNSAGSVTLYSKLKGLFLAGQVTVWQSGVRAGVGVADNTRIWGLANVAVTNGLFFRWNGTTFEVVARRAGSDTAVASASFNGEPDWEPTDANTTYRIEYSAGRALFYRASGGKKVLLHQMVDTAIPLVSDLNARTVYQNVNSGNTTSTSMYVRGSSISVWGSIARYNRGRALVTADYLTEVILGNISETTLVDLHGYNNGITTSSNPEDIWGGGGLYTGQPAHTASAETIDVSSVSANDTSAGTGARTVRLTGLDENWELQTEVVTLNGATNVTTSGSWHRMWLMEVLTVGSGGTNADVITAHHTTTTANVFAAIPTGVGHSHIGAYTIPDNHTGVIEYAEIKISRANGSDTQAEYRILTRESSGGYVSKRRGSITSSQPFRTHEKDKIGPFPERTDLLFRIQSVSDNTTLADCQFSILLTENQDT